MTERIQKSISFTKHYIPELEYAMEQPNFSRYVCNLIRRDRLRNDFKAEVEAIVEQRLNRKPPAHSVVSDVLRTFEEAF